MKKEALREEREINHFNELASQHGYAWWGSKTEAAKVRISRRINILKKLLSDNQHKILECGCASGEFTKEIADAFTMDYSIHALDLAESLVKIAKEKITKPNVNFYVGSITELPFNNDFFDAVIGNSILHHLDIEPALTEIKRVLKPNGKLIFFEPNMLNPQVYICLHNNYFRKLNQASPDETAFYKWDIKKTLLAIGFKNVSAKPFDFIHPLIPKNCLKIAKRIESLLEKTPINEIAGSLLITAEKP